MRIESKGIVISEIFTVDNDEAIEISADGRTVVLTLSTDDISETFSYDVRAFRQLLAAMIEANMQIEKIENPTAAA